MSKLWDARNLPLDANYVDKVVTNLPFGRQVSADEDIQLLNRNIMKEISRVMKRNGKAVILSERGHQLQTEAERLGLFCSKSYPLSLKGLHPTLYIFTKY